MLSARATVETLRRVESLDALSSGWARLPQPARELCLSTHWLATAVETLHEPGSLRMIEVLRDGEVVASAPLAVTRAANLERVEIAGAAVLFEPCGFAYRDPGALTELCRAVIDAGRPVVLQRIAVDDPLFATFKTVARGRGRLLQFSASGAPFVPISGSWEQYLQTLSARRRQDYRRARRNLEKLGQVSVDIRTPSLADVDAGLSEALQVEASSWKARNGSAMLTNPSLGGFYRSLARRLAGEGQLRLCFLRLDGVPVAMQIAAVYAQRWWVLKIGYDERWAEHSPGVQLMWEALREAFGLRLSTFEMLGSAEPWLTIWARDQRNYGTLAFYPYNLRGMTALGADIIGAMARRWRERDNRRTNQGKAATVAGVDS